MASAWKMSLRGRSVTWARLKISTSAASNTAARITASSCDFVSAEAKVPTAIEAAP